MMCEYCKSKKRLFKVGDGFDHLYIWIANNTINIDDHCEGQVLTEDSFPIKYCPMCGRQLNEH